MRDELSGIASAIEAHALPDTAEALFGSMWDAEAGLFVAQETFIVDFKDKPPEDFKKGFGASIVRLALAFHNTYGGAVVFGVRDEDFSPVGLVGRLDVEAFNDVLTDTTGARVECLLREYRLDGTEARVQVLLVPRRGTSKPVRLTRQLDKYPIGTLWVRDRHSVREATETNFSTLYSDRLDLSRSLSGDWHRSIHESLPPSPATMDEFIGRRGLLDDLWSWLVFGPRPRLYLHGPGGSGKSTLAYEFSRQVAERGSQIAFPNGDRLDYVIFISGKETELNPYNAAEQPFTLRQFEDAASQFRAILVDSGMRSKDDVAALDEDALIAEVSELFTTYAGLIVIDDVDALSRRGKDTGEESLLITCLGATKQTRILYTLRYPPSSALNSSVAVPELEAEHEFPQFIAACAAQFKVDAPPTGLITRLDKATSRLPLLTETVIGLKKVCGTYENALEQFAAKGGDDARRYLYQREYDRLDPAGRSREVLAALMLLDAPVSFSLLRQIIGTADNMILNALSECGSVFLSTKDERIEAQYQLATPAKPFIAAVSAGLNLFPVIKRRVELFLSEDPAFTPAESAFIVQLDRLVRDKRFVEVSDVFEARSTGDPLLANQKIQALAGQAYSNLGPDHRTKARECFTSAKQLKYFDIFMARAWFHVENFAEYGNSQAIEVCLWVLAQPKLSSRHRGEFKSKLASCYLEEARRARNISRERAVDFYSRSIEEYLSALWIGQRVQELSDAQTLRWLEIPAFAFIEYLGADLDPFFSLLDRLASGNHDLHVEGASVLINSLRRSSAGRDERGRAKILGSLRRTQSRIASKASLPGQFPGLAFLADALTRIVDHMQAARAATQPTWNSPAL